MPVPIPPTMETPPHQDLAAQVASLWALGREQISRDLEGLAEHVGRAAAARAGRNEELELAAALAHGLVGVLGLLGRSDACARAQRVQRLARELQLGGDDGDLVALAAEVDDLRRVLA